MTVLTRPAAIRNALRAIKPQRIAVAYVGEKWNEYLAAKNIQEIILSPTLGSNPYAIRELMKVVGAENVHFLDALHAKIYLGTDGALVGSCNLTENGLGDRGREEVAIHVTDEAMLRALGRTWARFKRMAQQQYRTLRAKEKALDKLENKWHIAIERGLATDERSVPSLADYNFEEEVHRIHVVAYYPQEPTYNEDAIRAAMPDVGPNLDDYIANALTFLEEDQINEHDWILEWKAYRDGRPRIARDNIEWMYVHHVVPGGAGGDQETKLAVEAARLIRPKPPFLLDAAAKKAIWGVFGSRAFPTLHPHKDDLWELAPADAVVPEFFVAVKKELRQGKARKVAARRKGR